jgi:hypothetical protein
MESYCENCKEYFYGWGKEICPVKEYENIEGGI